MARLFPRLSRSLNNLLATAALAAFACFGALPAFAQHAGGGGHVGGGGHAGASGGHASAPHVSAPPVTHYSAPAVTVPVAPAVAGTHRFVAVPPPVHLIPPPGSPRPFGGHGLVAPPPSTIPPAVIGFPPTGQSGPIVRQNGLGGPRGLSFSGEGHEIWQNAPAPDGFAGRGQGGIGVRPQPPHRFHPIPPNAPIFGAPFFGGPGFGLGFGYGLGWGVNSFWGPSCGPYWSWGYGCNALPYYDYLGLGYGAYYNNYENPPVTGNVEEQPENQANNPYEFQYPPAPLYGGGQRELVQLFLKDGTVYRATDYWLVSDELHFMTTDASGTTQTEHVIPFSELDLQQTVDVNTAAGFHFVLRNEPVQQYIEQQNGSQGAPENQVQPAQPPAAPPTPNAPPVPENPR